MDLTSCVVKFEGKKPKIVDFFIMANFLCAFFFGPKNQKWHWEVHLIFLKVAWGGSILGVIFGPEKKSAQKVSH